MFGPERACRRAHRLAREGKCDDAVEILERQLRGTAVSDVALDVLVTRIEVLCLSGRPREAVRWLREIWKDRPDGHERETLLRTADPALDPAADPTIDLISFLYTAWAKIGKPARCLALLRRLTAVAPLRRQLMETWQRRLAEGRTHPVAQLGLAHLHLCFGRTADALPFLLDLASPGGTFAEHVSALASTLEVDDEPEHVWRLALLHQVTGRGDRAAALYGRLVRRNAPVGIDLLRHAIADGHLLPLDAEELVSSALERTPTSAALRTFLAELCAETSRPGEAGEHLRALVAISDEPAALDEAFARIERLLETTPDHVDLLKLRAETLARRGRVEALEDALRQLRFEAPDRVVRILELLEELGHEPTEALQLFRAEALATIGRHPDAALLLRERLASEEDPARLLPLLARLAEAHEDEPAYDLALADALLRADQAGNALDRLESLTTRSPHPWRAVHELLRTSTFPQDVVARAVELRVRCALHEGLLDDALASLEALGGLAADAPGASPAADHRRSALLAALGWWLEWLPDVERAASLAGLLLEAGMEKKALRLLDEAATDPARAGVLLEVFDRLPHRGDGLHEPLRCRLRLELKAGRTAEAMETATALGEAGNLECAARSLEALLDRNGESDEILARLLDVATRRNRPAAEILRLAKAIRESRRPDRIGPAHDVLLAHHESADLGAEGVETLGWSALDLGRHAEAQERFTSLLTLDRPRAERGLLALLEARPDLGEVRATLVASLHHRGDVRAAGALLMTAPERTPEIWRVLDDIAVPDGGTLSWIRCEWLTAEGDRERLAAFLEEMIANRDVDPDRVEAVLPGGELPPEMAVRVHWIRIAVERRRGDDARAIAGLGRILHLDRGQVDRVLGTVDELRARAQEDVALLLDDLALSAVADRPTRVTRSVRHLVDAGASRAALDRAEDVLRHEDGRPALRGDPDLLRARLDLALARSDRAAARRALDRLLEVDELDASSRRDAARAWREGFGDAADPLAAEIRALLELGRPEATPPLVRALAGRPPEDRPGIELAPRAEARLLSEDAARAAPDHVAVRLLASELAATDDDRAAALEHALAPLGPGSAFAVAERLRRLHEDLDDDPRFALALAGRILGPAGSVEEAARFLNAALDRSRGVAEEVETQARELTAAAPGSAPALFVLARATVVLADRSLERARLALADLSTLRNNRREWATEALAGVETVLSLHPELLSGRFLRAAILRDLARSGEAVEEIREQILSRARRPEDVLRAHLELADALEASGRAEEALGAWRHGENLAPDDPAIPERIRQNYFLRLEQESRGLARASLRRAWLALWAGEPDAALAEARPAPEKDEEEPDFVRLALRASAHRRLDRPHRVVEELGPTTRLLEAAGQLSGAQCECLYQLGRAHLDVGPREQAVRCLERLARESPRYRDVRRLLESRYAEPALGAERPLELSCTVEEMASWTA